MNLKGEVIAVAVSKIAGSQSLGFAVPVTKYKSSSMAFLNQCPSSRYRVQAARARSVSSIGLSQRWLPLV